MATSLGTVRCPLIIGRDALLDLADRRLEQVVAGDGHLLLVSGEAGVGKSRFLGAIEAKAIERGFVADWGYVAPQDRDVPAASILDLARSLLRTPAHEALGRALIDLAAPMEHRGLGGRRRLVMEVVDRLLDAVTRPTVLGFEDLQWADDVSLEVIGELARRSRERPLLVAAGYRTDEAPPGTSLRDWRSRLVTQRIAEEVRLGPLTKDETALVTTLILDTGLPAPREVVEAVYERTDGIPLHIEELLGALSADARANGLAIREATVPDTIEDAVLARLAHRSAEAQAVARAGAIIGRCFVPEVLAGIMDMPPEAIDAPLQELVDDFILDPPGLRGLFDFRHQLLRDAIYRSVTVGERRRLHARAGEFGAQLEGQSEIHSSLHYERAGNRRRAFETALSGARDAARMSAHREAFELYRRAVAHLPADLPEMERGRILEAASEEAAAIEENALAESLARDAAAAYRTAGEPVAALLALTMVHSIERRESRPISEREASLARSTAELDGLPDTADARFVRGVLAAMGAMARMDARDHAAARALLDVARSGADDRDPELALLADWKAATMDLVEGRVASGLSTMVDIAIAADRDGIASAAVSAYRDAALAATIAMDYPAATRMVDAGLRYADAIEQSHCAHIMRATSAMVLWAGGGWDEAIAESRQAVADRGCRRGAEISRWADAYVAVGRGELDLATSIATGGYDFGLESEAIEMILPPLWALAEIDLQAGEPTSAADRCAEALDRSTAVGERLTVIPFVVTGVRAHLAADRPAGAATWLEACVRHLAGFPAGAPIALDHGRGIVALAEGNTGVARTMLEAAVRGWDGLGRIWEATWARLDLAVALTRAGRFAEAVPLVVEARTAASRLESRPLADRADALGRMARGRIAVDEPWRPLTVREFEVARLIRLGHTNAEIAESLGIAPRTASSHVEHILSKLGASRRAEIAAWASHVDRSPAPH
jgi:DNA-binding CsgD family transcriptional regulator